MKIFFGIILYILSLIMVVFIFSSRVIEDIILNIHNKNALFDFNQICTQDFPSSTCILEFPVFYKFLILIFLALMFFFFGKKLRK